MHYQEGKLWTDKTNGKHMVKTVTSNLFHKTLWMMWQFYWWIFEDVGSGLQEYQKLWDSHLSVEECSIL